MNISDNTLTDLCRAVTMYKSNLDIVVSNRDYFSMRNKELQTKLDAALKDNEELRLSHLEHETKISKLEDEVEKWKNKDQTAANHMCKMLDQIKNLQDEIDKLKKQNDNNLDTITSDNEALHKENRRLKEENAQLKSHCDNYVNQACLNTECKNREGLPF